MGDTARVTATLFVLTVLVAVGDWVAVEKRWFRIEYALKPLTLVLLLAATASADLPIAAGWVLAALVLALLGDIALMLSADRPGAVDGRFLLGLSAFLAGHVCYLIAFVRYGLHGAQLIAGLLVVVGIAALTLPRILTRVARAGGQELLAAVGAYAAVLATMTVLAVGTALPPTAAGGILFLVSDTLLAQNRFVRRVPHGELAVMVTYHLAQLLIVLGLATA
jgi:uncharacterized membrane protein YhhN